MNILKKLLTSTSRDDFSTMKLSKQLDVIRQEILKDIDKKSINIKR